MILWPLPWLPDKEPFRPHNCGPFPDIMFEACRFIALRKWRQLEKQRREEHTTRMRKMFSDLGFDYDKTIEYFNEK